MREEILKCDMCGRLLDGDPCSTSTMMIERDRTGVMFIVMAQNYYRRTVNLKELCNNCGQILYKVITDEQSKHGIAES